MPTDYYDDTTDSAAPTKPEPKTKAGDGSESSLLPVSFFPEKPEVGKVCKIKQEKIFSDQVQVSYVKHEETPEREEPEMMSETEDMMA